MQVKDVVIPFQNLIYRNSGLKGSLVASHAEIQDVSHAVVEHKIKLEINGFHGLPEIP